MKLLNNMSHKKSTKNISLLSIKHIEIGFLGFDSIIGNSGKNKSHVDISGLFLWFANWVDLRISWLNLLWKNLTLWVLSLNVKDELPYVIPIFFLSDLLMFVYTQMFSLSLLFCILGEYAWFDMTKAFLIFSYLAK